MLTPSSDTETRLLSDLTQVNHNVSYDDRQRRYGHSGAVIWLTGLSASGKSTLAMGLEAHLLAQGYACYTLDGDNIRHGLNANLGFSPTDRAENIRRVGEVAALFADAGLVCITSFISPYRHHRLLARQAAQQTSFHEIYVAADLQTCETRDPKGLYRKSREGTLSNFTGVNAPYEEPLSPDLVLHTNTESVEQSLERLLRYVKNAVPLISPKVRSQEST
ncbi:adenylyl-sulfate kinase [Leeia oryzae]|uniref:adenylyl-sulfate kinase n=1 Tax=Leeia oryzae TaxID=356662 RepID=UPI0003A6CD9C|nr:adenylyl-sulfate kinase [Leeia oryzae]